MTILIQLIIILGLAALLFPAIRRRLKGAFGLAAAAFVLFLLVVIFAAGH